MSREPVHVVKPARCAHRWVFFGRSGKVGGYYRCSECGGVKSDKHIQAEIVPSDVAELLSDLYQSVMFGEGK